MPADSREEEADDDLADATVALLEKLSRAYTDRPVADSLPTATEWIEYLTGELPPGRIARLTHRATVDPVARQHLRQTFHTLEALKTRPLSWDTGESVADTWRAIVTRIGDGFCRSVTDRLRADGERLWEAGSGALQEAFRADARRARAALPLSPRVAVVRGGTEPRLLPVLNAPGTTARVRSGTVSPDGAVSLSVVWADTVPEGKTVYLGMQGAAGGWLLAAAPCEAGVSRWEVPRLGAALSLPAGPLPLEGFYLSVGSFLDLPNAGAMLLPAAVVRADGIRIADALLEVRALRATGEAMHFTLVVPDAVRSRHASALLALDLRLGRDHAQRLAEWALSDWESDSREVAVPIPPSGADPAALAALLAATLFEGVAHRD